MGRSHNLSPLWFGVPSVRCSIHYSSAYTYTYKISRYAPGGIQLTTNCFFQVWKRSQGKINCLRNQNLGAIAFFALNRVQRGHRLPLVKLIHILKNNRRTSKMLTDDNHQSLHARGFSQLRNSCMGCRVYWHILFQGANTLWRQSFVLADITLILSCEF